MTETGGKEGWWGKLVGQMTKEKTVGNGGWPLEILGFILRACLHKAARRKKALTKKLYSYFR